MERMFGYKPDFNRLRKALLRDGEPDIVPFCEIWVDAEVITNFTGKPYSAESLTEFYYRLGYDFVPAGASFGYPHRVIYADDTAELSRGVRSFVDDNRGTIENRKDFDEYEWPEIDASVATWVNDTNKILPDGMKSLVITPGGILENVMWLTGFSQLSYMLYDDEQLLFDMFERIGKNHIKMMRTLFENTDPDKIGAVCMGDDMGFKHSTMFAPEFLRKYVFGWQKKMVDLVHEYDKPMILHCCGNINAIMDEIIDYVGFDAKHSFEDCFLSVVEAKKKYGDRIALVGGVDMHFICTATHDEIVSYVDNIIANCAPGGGYALGTGSSFANYVPVKNWMTMLEEGRRSGKYPINKK
ncbi:MAG: uroporphyrinogen decarboxylase family protein [Saccharofermentanales bacterium]